MCVNVCECVYVHSYACMTPCNKALPEARGWSDSAAKPYLKTPCSAMAWAPLGAEAPPALGTALVLGVVHARPSEIHFLMEQVVGRAGGRGQQVRRMLCRVELGDVWDPDSAEFRLGETTSRFQETSQEGDAAPEDAVLGLPDAQTATEVMVNLTQHARLPPGEQVQENMQLLEAWPRTITQSSGTATHREVAVQARLGAAAGEIAQPKQMPGPRERPPLEERREAGVRQRTFGEARTTEARPTRPTPPLRPPRARLMPPPPPPTWFPPGMPEMRPRAGPYAKNR